MNFLRNVLLYIFFTIPACGFAQKMQDVLYLKNGWILRGKAVGTTDSVKITTSEGNTFIFHNNEVQELGSGKQPEISADSSGQFFHNTEWGMFIANGIDAPGNTSILNTAGLSFQTINGHKIKYFLQIGIGIGMDVYARQIFVPVFLSIRGDFAKRGSVRLFYFIDYGHGFNITKNTADNNWVSTSYSPGYTLGVGAGLKVKAGEKTFLFFSLGHHSQKSVIETIYSTNSRTQENLTYNRFALRFGFGF